MSDWKKAHADLLRLTPEEATGQQLRIMRQFVAAGKPRRAA